MGHRSPCATAGTLPDCPFLIGPLLRLEFSLLCNRCDSIEESDQVFPDQVIDGQHDVKCQRHIHIVNLHHIEIDEAAVCDF